MSNIFDPAVPQSNPATPVLPSQYQDPLNLANQRQMIAQFLTMQALQPHPPQQIGPVAAQISPLNGILSAIAPIIGSKVLADAAGDASRIRQQYASDTQRGLAGMLAQAQGHSTPQIDETPGAGSDAGQGMLTPETSIGIPAMHGVGADPQGAINTGFTSMNPMMQAMATTLQSQEIAKREAMAKAYASGNYVNPQLDILSGKNPANSPSYTPPATPPVTNFLDVPDTGGQVKVAQTVTTDPATGKMTAEVGRPVGENLLQKSAAQGIIDQAEQLKSGQASALLGQKIQGQVADAVRALQDNALSGGGSDWKQQAAKVLQALGVTGIDSTSSTDQLKNALTGLLTDYGKILGSRVTNLDLGNVKQYVGTIDTDPKAMVSILSGLSAAGIKSIQDYDSMLSAREKSGVTTAIPGYNPDLLTREQLRNANVDLPGPTNMRFMTLQALHNYGGDVTKYGIEGKPFEANSTFNIRPEAVTSQTPNPGQPVPEQPMGPVHSNGKEFGRVINGKWTLTDKNGVPLK